METAALTPNTSGQGALGAVPPEIDRWNWGAFLLNWIWGLGNNTPIALLMWVPLVNVPMLFVLGIRGSAWAWRNKRWASVEHFRRVQRRWALWGAALWLLVLLAIGGMVAGLVMSFRHSQAYQLALDELRASPVVIAAVGEPVRTGLPMGRVEVHGPSGYAAMSFKVEGPKGHGTVYLEATKSLGRWRLDALVFESAAGERFDLRACRGRLSCPPESAEPAQSV
jgi:hypothetical protein